MKNKYTKLLLLFCSIFMFWTFVQAEDTVNNIAKCSKEGTDASKKACCARIPNESERNKCFEPLYKKCANLTGKEEKNNCCATGFADTETACKTYVRTYCSNADSVRLSKEAYAVDVKYEPIELKPEGYDDPNSQYYSTLVYGLDIKIYNVTPDIVVTVTPSRGKTYSVSSTDRNESGVIVLRDLDVAEIKTMRFVVTSADGSCEDKTLRTINLTIPKYNQLSNRESCMEVPSYYQCRSFVTYDIDKTNFLRELNAYTEKLAKQGIKKDAKESESKKGILKKTIKTVSNNKWLVVGTIIAIGVLATILIAKKRRED